LPAPPVASRAAVHDVRAAAGALAVEQQVHGEAVLQQGHARGPPDALEQGALDLASRDVARVQDAAVGVAGLQAQVHDRRALGEAHAQVLQLAHPLGRLRHGQADDVLVAEAGARHQGVAQVVAHAVRLAHDGGDAALRVVGVGIGGLLLGGQRHGPQAGELARAEQPGDAGAQDQEVGAAGGGLQKSAWKNAMREC
jgi:hypothetical protein